MKYLTPLLSDDLRILDIPEPWAYGIADRTRFGELDALVHVNHTAYLRWLEALRIRYFFDYGISDYGPDSPRIVLRQIGMDYLAEMGLNQDYVVTGRTTELRRTSFRMEYAIFVDGQQKTTGHAILVLLNRDGTKRAISDEIRQTLINRDGAAAL